VEELERQAEAQAQQTQANMADTNILHNPNQLNNVPDNVNPY